MSTSQAQTSRRKNPPSAQNGTPPHVCRSCDLHSAQITNRETATMSTKEYKTAKKSNMEDIQDAWSPYEDHIRRENGEQKIESLENRSRPLRGGNWIASRKSIMTLSFCWKMRGRTYGLSTAHGFDDYGATDGQSVFAFDSDKPVVPMHDSNGKCIGYAHKNIKIGSIVSMDQATDSAVFEIDPGVPVRPLEIALSGRDGGKQVKIELPTPETSEKKLPYGSKLIMFGASRRGMIGYRVSGDPHDVSAGIAVQSNNDGDDKKGHTKLTFEADCGAVYFDEGLSPFCIHTTIQGMPRDTPRTWTSRGVALQSVVNAHAFYFGQDPLLLRAPTSLSSASSFGNPSSPCKGAVTGEEVSHEKSEDVEVVLCTMSSVDSGSRSGLPILYFPQEQDTFVEKQKALTFAKAGITLYFSTTD